MSTTTFYHKQQPIRLTDKQGYFMPYFDDVSDLYPWTMKNIDSFSLQEQDQVLKNLKDVEWIKQFIQKLNPGEHETFKLTIISALENPEMPLHVLSLSAMIYNLKIIGIESSDLEQAVNNSERVRQEAYDMVMFKIESRIN